MFKPTSYRLNEDNTSDKERTDQTNSLYSVYCKADLSIVEGFSVNWNHYQWAGQTQVDINKNVDINSNAHDTFLD
jgi:hypothetical protein